MRKANVLEAKLFGQSTDFGFVIVIADKLGLFTKLIHLKKTVFYIYIYEWMSRTAMLVMFLLERISAKSFSSFSKFNSVRISTLSLSLFEIKKKNP